jgi:hypothetical protein
VSKLSSLVRKSIQEATGSTAITPKNVIQTIASIPQNVVQTVSSAPKEIIHGAITSPYHKYVLGEKAEQKTEEAVQQRQQAIEDILQQMPDISKIYPQMPEYQAPTPEELTRMGTDYVKTLEKEFGYKPVEDLREEAKRSVQELADIERQREGAQIATSMAGMGTALSPAYASALARSSGEIGARERGELLKTHQWYQQALEEEARRRMGMAEQQKQFGYEKAIQDYLLGKLTPFQYQVDIAGQKYQQSMLPIQARLGNQDLLLGTRLGRIQRREAMNQNILGHLGGALAAGVGLAGLLT